MEASHRAGADSAPLASAFKYETLLFLGSGVSYDTGLPKVPEITQSVLSGDWRWPLDSYIYSGFAASQDRPDKRIARVQEFLRILKSLADEYLKRRGRGATNYEDLFYMARQVEDEATRKVDNPLIEQIVDQLRAKTEVLCLPIKRVDERYSLAKLAEESCELIECAVWRKLTTKTIPPKNLTLLNELASRHEIERCDICTLNHDLLAESQMDIAQVKFEDGFAKPDGDIRWFDPKGYDESDAKARLFKLHGSINWWRLAGLFR